MKLMQRVWLLCLLGCALGVTGCRTSQWQIVDISYAFSAEGEKEDDSNYDSKFPVLMNTRTGQTWMLYPMTGDRKRVEDEDDHGYSWVPIPVK